MNISLVMVTGDGKAKELPALRLPLIIGRSEECKLRIPLAAVSRQHCELAEDDDELVVRDLKSSNGTFVNRERIKSRELLPGDLICVGPVVFAVRIDGHPKDVDPHIAWANGAVSAANGPGSEPAMIDGVPTWAGGSSHAKTEMSGPASAPAPAKPAAAPKSAPKLTPKPEEEDFGSLMKDLSESDFDIDFGDDEPKQPGKK